jgi:site-specific DNA recombinase
MLTNTGTHSGTVALDLGAALQRLASPGPNAGSGARAGVLRAAFVGRTSNEDLQDPTLSLPRQLRRCADALPDGAVIACHFYDVESGRKDLAARGHGRAHEAFDIPIPRDGGIADLLAEAERAERRFDVVICESVDRIARRTHYATLVEHKLEQAGVPLLAADEPINLDGAGGAGRRGPKASQVLYRRTKQGVAEWYVLEMLEKSWGGFETHTEQGYNIGKPPYGYTAEKIPHPVPAKRAEHKTKTRLIPDPTCAQVVRQIFELRVGPRLGYKAIAERLNADIEKCPPPVPVDPARAVGKWTQSSVYEILHNPKYTGYMVWNRRASKSGRGKVNPVSEWVWSPQVTHEALVSRETFLEAWNIAGHRERSRAAGRCRHPQTKREYRLRTYLFCAGCGRRMFGKTRREHAYYACAPAGAAPDGHPASFWVQEQPLLDGVNQFFSRAVFGQDRHALLARQLAGADTRARTDRAAGIAAQRKALADIDKRRARLMHVLETTDDPDGELTRQTQTRLAELRTDNDAAHATLRDLEHEPDPTPTPALLGALPAVGLDLARVPAERLRPLFEAFRLRIDYDKPTNTARCRVTIAAETLPALRAAIMTADGPAVPICSAPPAGFEPALPPPEGGALSPELRGPQTATA